MSSNAALLSALSRTCDAELRYCELLQMNTVPTISSATKVSRKRLYFCLGRHAIHMIKRDLSGVCQPDSPVFFAHIEKIIVDSNTTTDFVVVLASNARINIRVDKLFFVSLKRAEVISVLSALWAADWMWRCGSVKKAPVAYAELTDQAKRGTKYYSPQSRLDDVD